MRVRTSIVGAIGILVAVVALAACGGGSSAAHWRMTQAGPGMMGYVSDGPGRPVRTLAEARAHAQRFADQLDLRAGEVMRFSNNDYVELVASDGSPATEVLVDRASGATWVEYGPAMMWNTKYGMLSDFVPEGGGGMMAGGSGAMMSASGMMGGGGMTGGAVPDSTYAPSPSQAQDGVSAAEAEQIAGQWLRDHNTGLTAGQADAFPGYYTLHTLRDGEVAGMLSVNAYTGAVWYHWWHGRFLSMSEGG